MWDTVVQSHWDNSGITWVTHPWVIVVATGDPMFAVCVVIPVQQWMTLLATCGTAPACLAGQ